MKKDVFKHKNFYEKWENKLTSKYIEGDLTKANSELFISYIKNISESKSIGYANRNRSKVKAIIKGLQEEGVSDLPKAKLKQIEDYFYKWKKAGHSDDYAKRWNAFWNWYKEQNRREGKVVQDLSLKLGNFKQNDSGESSFVWLTKDEFDKLRSYFDEDKQTILLFMFDSLIRFPTEILSLKTENIFQKNGEVWVEIPKEISKTIGRKFNLVYAGESILNYIKKYDKKQGEYLFEFSPVMFNKEMQKVAKQLFDGKKSEGGEFYKKITGYDIRHSGAIHFRQLFQKTGQSLDLLRERGGWNNFDIINYYTKRLGLDGHIQKEKLLLQEDKTKIEKEVGNLKEVLGLLVQNMENKYKDKTKIEKNEAQEVVNDLNQIVKIKKLLNS
ncbi:hypothetical protein COU58_04235 [Candidatus Pacearchaeota archaeon CG10_big_fil_rev_8_21_14_0_10_32_42]|nr:MAG: hypothetical protein COU58_04235 [Candidatus Pacearchaeota archaeon CG10_big_fil_rev_8_21_14_0_10_32_42]